jgi:hypothetical protein
VDVFVLLLGSIHFLFLLLLSPLQIPTQVHVPVLTHSLQCAQTNSLVNSPTARSIDALKEGLESGGVVDEGDGVLAVEVVYEDLHLW